MSWVCSRIGKNFLTVGRQRPENPGRPCDMREGPIAPGMIAAGCRVRRRSGPPAHPAGQFPNPRFTARRPRAGPLPAILHHFPGPAWIRQVNSQPSPGHIVYSMYRQVYSYRPVTSGMPGWFNCRHPAVGHVSHRLQVMLKASSIHSPGYPAFSSSGLFGVSGNLRVQPFRRKAFAGNGRYHQAVAMA